jgi:hypothetical protein
MNIIRIILFSFIPVASFIACFYIDSFVGSAKIENRIDLTEVNESKSLVEAHKIGRHNKELNEKTPFFKELNSSDLNNKMKIGSLQKNTIALHKDKLRNELAIKNEHKLNAVKVLVNKNQPKGGLNKVNKKGPVKVAMLNKPNEIVLNNAVPVNGIPIVNQNITNHTGSVAGTINNTINSTKTNKANVETLNPEPTGNDTSESSTSNTSSTTEQLDDENEEKAEKGIHPFSMILYSMSNGTVPFVNVYKSTKSSNEFYNAINSSDKRGIFDGAVFIGTADAKGKLNFELEGSDESIVLFSEYAGRTQIIFENKVSSDTAFEDQSVILNDVDGVFTIRGKVIDEDDKPIRYAEIITDKKYVGASFEVKGAGTYAKTDKYGKYMIMVESVKFPLEIICKVKDLPTVTVVIENPSFDSLFIDDTDFTIPKDKNYAAIKLGSEWLVKQQNEKTGYFSDKLPHTNTALACLALLAHGHLKKNSEYKEYLRKGILSFCNIDKPQKNYYFNEGRMYSHALVSLALSEAYGVLDSENENQLVRSVLEKTIGHIVEAQNKKEGNLVFGGWRYTPKVEDADLSVSALQILALHSAKNNNISIPLDCWEDASEFVRNSFSKKSKAFSYKGNGSSHAMRSAGVVAMNLLKLIYSKEDISKISQSASYLLKYKPNSKANHFWYTSYYMYTAASILGGEYRKFIPKLKESIIQVQNPNGSFGKESKNGKVYSTAFALIVLGSPIVD